MASRNRVEEEREMKLDREAALYREAATNALEQLEWIIGYLRKIHKPEIAAVLDRNAKQIASSMRSPR
jgi:hypothetical protein